MASNAPIGIFDSGVGGLTVARAIAQLLPKESFVYYGDTAHLPYGDKSEEAIKEYSRNITRYLIGQGAKAIVIACNTASAVAFQSLVDEFGNQLPIINVLDPVAEAVSIRKHKHVGVIGTRATIRSEAYSKRLHEYNGDAKISSLATPLLVPVIEEGLAHSNISTDVLKHYLGHETLNGIDSLILGCTHYPILHDAISAYYHNQVHVVDSPQIVAETVSQVLAAKNLLADERRGSKQFFLSDYTETFDRIAKEFFGDDLILTELPI